MVHFVRSSRYWCHRRFVVISFSDLPYVLFKVITSKEFNSQKGNCLHNSMILL